MATVRGHAARAIFRALALALLAPACEPNLVVGTWSCPVGPRVENDAGVLDTVTGPIASPWSTGFEQGFCDYQIAQGFCYARPDASFEIVDAPVHGGEHAAAFTIHTDEVDGKHTRCGREGTLPPDALYGAWYYIPELRDGLDNWNLFHFQGGEPGTTLLGTWDVTLERQDDDELHLFVRSAFVTGPQRPAEPVPILIGSWFHIEFRLRRATDTTGLAQLYQDDRLLVDLPGVQTERSTFGQWYVGNLANGLMPPNATVYVDDVTIRPPP